MRIDNISGIWTDTFTISDGVSYKIYNGMEWSILTNVVTVFLVGECL